MLQYFRQDMTIMQIGFMTHYTNNQITFRYFSGLTTYNPTQTTYCGIFETFVRITSQASTGSLPVAHSLR